MDEPFYYFSAEVPVPRDAVYVIIGGTVTVVAPRTFLGCKNLARVELREGVEAIGRGAFGYCFNLTRVDCKASSLRTIGQSAFSRCQRLSEVILQEGLEEIGKRAFCGCSLRRIAVPSSVLEIGEEAFVGCEGLSEVILAEGLRRIGAKAFNSCDLERIAVPSSVVEIGKQAFSYCDNIEEVTLAGGMVMMARGAFHNCRRLERIAISSVAIVVKAGEDGNGKVVTVTGGIKQDPTNESARLILASPHLASMRPEDLMNLTDAIDRITAAAQGGGPLDLANRDVSGRIRDGFVDHLSAWYRWYLGEAATILELGLWKIKLGRAGAGEVVGAEVPTRDDSRRTCGADPIVGLVLSSLAGPQRRTDQGENAGSIQP